MTPYTQATCDKIGEDTSTCQKPTFSDFTGDDAVQNYWVTYAIYSSYSFWVSMYQAIYNADSIVSASVGKIVTTFDPPTPPSTPPWEYALDALTFGLSLYSEGSIFTKALLRSLPQTSTLIGKVYPDGQVEGTVTEWADVAAAVGSFCQTWANDIAAVVPQVNNDPTSLTAIGGELLSTQWDFSSLTNSLITSVGTYMASAAAQAAGYIITRTETQSIAAFSQSNAANMIWDTGCEGGSYDSSGICGGIWYYDGTDTYSLVNTQKPQANTSNIFGDLFYGSPPLADPGLFFTGSLSCSQTCGSNGGCSPSQDTDLDPTCLASVRVCTWQWTADNYYNDPFYPDCTNQETKDFGDGEGDDDLGMCVPLAYFNSIIDDPSWAGTLTNSGCPEES